MTDEPKDETEKPATEEGPPQPKPKYHSRFKPGQSGNPQGRAKGTKVKLQNTFWRDMYGVWEKHGAEALERMANESPAKFCAMVAQLMPKQIDVRSAPLEDMSEDDIAGALADIRRFLGAAGAIDAAGPNGRDGPETQH